MISQVGIQVYISSSAANVKPEYISPSQETKIVSNVRLMQLSWDIIVCRGTKLFSFKGCPNPKILCILGTVGASNIEFEGRQPDFTSSSG